MAARESKKVIYAVIARSRFELLEIEVSPELDIRRYPH
jgi:hypothetical protein